MADPNRPRCIVCGKPIAKRYHILWFRQPAPAMTASPFNAAREAIEDGTRIKDTFYLASPPTTKDEAQRYSNHTIQRIIGWQGEHITGATYWDGENYVDRFFDKDKCAVAQGYASAHHGARFKWKDDE
jgi:hypothetical protein